MIDKYVQFEVHGKYHKHFSYLDCQTAVGLLIPVENNTFYSNDKKEDISTLKNTVI